jgi:hypothetical protein
LLLHVAMCVSVIRALDTGHLLGRLEATFLLAATAAAGLMGYLTWKDVQRTELRAAGLCVQCGYDLRGSRDRCPECGKQFVRLRSLRPPSWMPKRVRKRRRG